MTQQIKLPPLPHLPLNDPAAVFKTVHGWGRAAIEADRQERHTAAEEVCSEAYQVVGSLLSDLGIFETDRAGKFLDNLSKARRVHGDVLPWPSLDRQARGEPVAWISDSPTKGNGKRLFWTKTDAWRWSSNIEPLYTIPQIPEGYKLVPVDGDDFKVCAIADSNYAAGMLLGWNLCVDNDEATFSRVREDRLRAAAQASRAAMLEAAPEPKGQ